MKVMITGGTGFLGGALARRLQGMGADVSVVGRNQTKGKALEDEGIRFIRADLSDEQAIIKACEDCDYVYHSGALASPWGPYETFYNANVVGTENVVKGCQEHKVKRLIHVSTPSIYQTYRDRINVKESEPLPEVMPSFYAQTKYLAEKVVDKAHEEGLEVISIRPRAIIGPGDTTVFPRLIRLLRTGRLRIIGNGKNRAEFGYIDNVLDALLLCQDAPSHCLGEKYNITNGEPVYLWEMVAKLCQMLDLPAPTKKVPLAVANALAIVLETFSKWFQGGKEPVLTRYSVNVAGRSITLNIEKARKELGYEPKVGNQESLERFVAWWKEYEKAL